LTPATLIGVSGRPILASAESTANDGVFVGDQSTVTGAEHNSPVATTKPSALSFFMTVYSITPSAAKIKTVRDIRP
jgi:hypothetical protein